MHIHILGICGSFMAGVAVLAQELGHRVSGADAFAYPPMSTQLAAIGIRVAAGFSPANLKPAPELVIIGNALSRGNPEVEAVLDRGLPYISGAQWIAEHVLRERWVLAVAGTHGKTTTTSIIAWILEHVGLHPGFLIGGVPLNFRVSARLGSAPFFIIEADEYDTAFFDKRSKFVHYRPRTAILNNLEFDHADIFPDLNAIKTQFHYFVRTLPPSGRLIVNAQDAHLRSVLAMGCWTPVEYFGDDGGWQAASASADGRAFRVLRAGKPQGEVRWPLLGEHNMLNALAALAAACHAGAQMEGALTALSRFAGVERRLQLRASVNDIALYDDFAHHPSAIAASLRALRALVGARRIFAVLELRSNSMRMGVHRDVLAASLGTADQVLILEPAELGWDLRQVAAMLGARAHVLPSVDAIVARLAAELRPRDQVLVMSNGNFGGLQEMLLARLSA
jgi:UDP-N-acetylmuramate: L-alanyl-gamma-D-glutamyl-meso-diaminopimelate ligase